MLKMNLLTRTVLLLIGGIIFLGLIILFLPFLIILYLFMPRQRSRSWMNTFAQQARFRTKKSEGNDSEAASSREHSGIPASQDIIDIKADEVKEK
jgi:Na+-transporting methylmalonyl-CoA/oxaloacetate decarboxylase gamma subunit